MPRKTAKSEPPQVMTWGKATPIIVVSLVFDALRFMFTMFWFFGPALAALYCTSAVNDFLGTSVAGTVGNGVATVCTAGAAVLGFSSFAFTATFGTIMAMAVGFAGWLVIGLIILMTNSRIFKENVLWFGASLLISEVPFLNSIPAFTIIVWKMYGTQIKKEEAEMKKWKKENVDAQAQEKQQCINAMQMSLTQQERDQQNIQLMRYQATQQEYGSEETTETGTPQAHIQLQSASPQFLERARVENYETFAKEKRQMYGSLDRNTIEVAKSEMGFEISTIEHLEHDIELYKTEIEHVRSDIDEKKIGIISKVLNYKQIQTLGARLGGLTESLTATENAKKQREELVRNYKMLIVEEEALGSLIEEAGRENKLFDQTKQFEFLEEEKRRDLTKLSKIHGAFFVHDIVVADWKPSANNKSINTQNLNWGDQFDILDGLAPTISASTVRQGTKETTFSRSSWGVFLSGGRVLGGGQGDVGTVATGLHSRSVATHMATTQAIEKAILRTSGGEGYNEVVVESPEVAGVYVKWDDKMSQLEEGVDIYLGNKSSPEVLEDRKFRTYGQGRDRYSKWWDDIQEVTKRSPIIFVLDQRDNSVREIFDIDVVQRSFRVTPKLDPVHVLAHRRSQEQKNESANRVFDKVSESLTDEERERFSPKRSLADEISEGVRETK